MDRQRQRRKPLPQARAGPGNDDVVDRSNLTISHGRHPDPAGAYGDVSRARTVGRVAKHDHLRVECHQPFEGNRKDGRVGCRDRISASQVDHVGDERVRGRTVNLWLIADLVESSRPVEVA